MKLSPEKETFMTDLISVKCPEVWPKNTVEKNDEIYDEHILTAIQ